MDERDKFYAVLVTQFINEKQIAIGLKLVPEGKDETDYTLTLAEEISDTGSVVTFNPEKSYSYTVTSSNAGSITVDLFTNCKKLTTDQIVEKWKLVKDTYSVL